MKKILFILMVALMAAGFTVSFTSASLAAEERQEVENRLELNNVTAEELAATGAVPLETAKKIVELREQLGSFQKYEDLEELKIPEEQFKQLQYKTTIQGIASDCTC